MPSNDNDSNVVILDVFTRLDIPPMRVLQSAIQANMTKCIVIGYDKDGGEYFHSSVAVGGDALWMIERAKLKLLRLADN